MATVLKSAAFDAWLTGLRDNVGRARILARIDRLEAGNPGDHKSVGDGVMELRITFGPGYRVYYTERDGQVFLLLGGGDKGSQERDIAAAKALAAQPG